MSRTAYGGEGMEVLSILLADLSILLQTIQGHGYAPGLLIHDSPREADLGPHLYERYLTFAGALHKHCATTAGSIPFQYIVCTTTPPPKHLQGSDFVKLPLSVTDENELLLRKQVSVAVSSQGELAFLEDQG